MRDDHADAPPQAKRAGRSRPADHPDAGHVLPAHVRLTPDVPPDADRGPAAISLPKTEGGGQETITNPPDVEDEELIVQVYAADNGAPVDITAALKTGNVPFGTDTGKLFAFLKERAASAHAAKQATPKLRLEFADKLNYQFVIKMLDEARRAGFDRISPDAAQPRREEVTLKRASRCQSATGGLLGTLADFATNSCLSNRCAENWGHVRNAFLTSD